MKVPRAVLLVAAGVFALGLNIYLYMHVLVNRSEGGAKLAADDCASPETVATANPNKMLFISCGGFLE